MQELLLQTKKGLNLPLSVSIALYKGLLYMLVIPWRNVSDDSQVHYTELILFIVYLCSVVDQCMYSFFGVAFFYVFVINPSA